MIKNVLLYENEKDRKILTQKSVETNIEESKQLIEDLKDTLNASKNGCGISAVQIGELKRVCVIKYNNKEIVMINPVITRTRGEVKSEEGCLSAPHLFGEFIRAQKVWCEYTDENGNRKEIAEGGLCSRIIQHELEHMDGWCKVFSLVK